MDRSSAGRRGPLHAADKRHHTTRATGVDHKGAYAPFFFKVLCEVPMSCGLCVLTSISVTSECQVPNAVSKEFLKEPSKRAFIPIFNKTADAQEFVRPGTDRITQIPN